MKGIFRKLGFHKMDEMERHILFASQRNSYLFLIGALLAWSLYESYKVYAYHVRLNLLPCLLLVGAVGIQNISQFLMVRFAVKDSEDPRGTVRFPKAAVMIGIIAFAIAAIVTAWIVMNVVA